MHYLILLIPVILGVVYYFITPEYFITVAKKTVLATVISLILFFSALYIDERVKTTSIEYWNSFIAYAEYYEAWNEYIQQTCTKTDCDANNNCVTTTYDCSYVKYHPEYWQAITTTKEIISITEAEYNNIVKKFRNTEFEELNRDYYTNDGDKYYSTWNNDSITAIPATTKHTYQNRIKAANQSAFHFKKPTEKEINQYNLKQYPKFYSNYEMPFILADTGITYNSIKGNKLLRYYNAILGDKKQACVFFILFKNKPIEAAFYQEALWSGANKNEFVVCIGVDNNNKIKWCRPFSWTPIEKLKISVRNNIQDNKMLNILQHINYVCNEVNRQFVRRQFAEFKYLDVAISDITLIICAGLIIVVSIGCLFIRM